MAGQLYVAGYLDDIAFEAIGDTWSYDPASDAWTQRATMPVASERGAAATAVLDGLVYVVGGLRGGAAVADAWTYDPATDSWGPLAPLPSPRDELAAAAIGGKLYVVGGRDTDIGAHTDALDIYDPATGAWSSGAPMPTSRGSIVGAAVGDWLFVGGGEGNPDDPDGVFGQWEVYDATTDTWASLPDMPTPRHGTGAAVIDAVIYVPGGAEVQNVEPDDTHEAWTVGG